jgi:PPOX class probable F420-dependent enzyme
MAITDAKYVSITTYRKSGAEVASPVWIAALGDGRAGFVTGADSGKVKRIRNNAGVTLRPCSMRGVVAEGAETVHATAAFLTGAEYPRVRAAIVRKYGIVARVMFIPEKVVRLVKRKTSDANGAVVLTFD